MKKLGKILVFTALGLFAAWIVCFCLRYLIWQKSIALGKGFADHFKAAGAVFFDLHYFDDNATFLLKLAGFVVFWFTLGLEILLLLEVIFKKQKLVRILSMVAVAAGGYAVIDYIGMSGDYAHHLGRFAWGNVFYTLGLIGFIALSFVLFAVAVASAVFVGNEKEECCCEECACEAKAEEEAPAQEEAPAEEPAAEEEQPAEQPAEEAPAEEPAQEEPAAEEPAPEEAPAEEDAPEEAPAEEQPAEEQK